ncbi:nucleolar protein 14 [Melampsora americana]|nr:nucleolar protein 14 [Melampsora americana]
MARTEGGKKASQLSQLKQSIRTAGLSRVSKPPIPGRSGDRGGKKTRSSLSSATKDPEFRQKKLAEIQASQNLFDLKSSKVKFPTSNLLHQRQNGSLRGASKNPLVKTVGKPAQSATQAHQRRVEKLLPEYRNRHKSTTFLDKRFGEGDSSLTPEEKALERFTRERQMRLPGGAKRNIFNLDDDAEGLYDEDGEADGGLTHGGMGLDLDDDEVDDGRDEDILKLNKQPLNLHNLDGRAEDNEDRQKSKAEVMSEIITKSKAHKYERQQMRDKDEALRYDLDAELKDIRSLLLSSAPKPATHTTSDFDTRADAQSGNSHQLSNTDPGQLAELQETHTATSHEKCDISLPHKATESTNPTAIDQDLLSKLLGSSKRSSSPETDHGDKDEDMYDRFVRELAFDPRAKPSDRLKTAEEEALEEAERLRMLEQKRLKRMRGLDDDDDDDDEGGRKNGRTKRKPEADDLEDDFVSDQGEEEDWSLGEGLRPDGAFGASVQQQEGSSEATSESECSSSNDENDQSDVSDWEGFSESSHKEKEGKDFDSLPVRSLVSSTVQDQSVTEASATRDHTQELAYTYPCPTSHAEFLSIISQKSVKSSDLPTVVQRIRVLYHPSLGEDNKSKLITFTNVLIDHVIHITSLDKSDSSASPFGLVNKLLPHIISLCQSFTQSSAMHFVSKLGIMQKNLTQALLGQTSTGWPGLCELTLLRLIGLIWSTSDFSHPVVAPAVLIICQYLSQLQVKRYKDMMSGLFMCTLILQYEALSKRLVPEAINFLLLSALRLTSSKLDITSISLPLPASEGTDTLMFPLTEEVSASLEPQTLDLVSLLTKEDCLDTPFPSEQDKVDTLDVILSLLANYSTLYTSSPQYTEVFSTVLSLIKRIEGHILICEVTKIRLKELIETIEIQLATAKRIRQLNPLRLQLHRPIPIKPQTPQFESTFTPKQKEFNPDSAQVEVNKLKSLIKKEKKGAMRELRKDNKFLAIEKAKEKDEADLAYKTKIARITAGLQQERSEEKKQERTKVRLKKLDKLRGSKK